MKTNEKEEFLIKKAAHILADSFRLNDITADIAFEAIALYIVRFLYGLDDPNQGLDEYLMKLRKDLNQLITVEHEKKQ